MTDARPPLAKLATDALSNERMTIDAPSAMHRARAIALIASTIESEARQRRRRRWAIGVAAAAIAASSILAVGSSRHRAPPAVAKIDAPAITGSAHALSGDGLVLHDGVTMHLDGAQSIVVGDHVVAPNDARAAVTLSTGTHIVVEEGGDLAVVEQDATQIYALQSGALQADVAKLHSGERFVVRTLDAEVEVRGTSFHLAVVPSDASCGGGTTTRLKVTEGAVAVRASGVETLVPAGESWPKCVEPEAAPAPAHAPVASPVASPVTSPVPSPVPAPAPAKTTISASELAAQNDVFAHATAAKNSGDVQAAIAGYEHYLAKYPGGALAENAVVERMRLLQSIDPRRAALAAKSYLARYPNGFARVEAERLAAEAP